MATATAADDYQLNFLDLNIANWRGATLSSVGTNMIVGTLSASHQFYLGGTYRYNADGSFIGGTITSITEVIGNPIYTITGFSINYYSMNSWVASGDTASAMQAVFGGDDVITGSGLSDTLSYYGGNDYFDGRSGYDRISFGSGLTCFRNNATVVHLSGNNYYISTPYGKIKTSNIEAIWYSVDGVIPINSGAVDAKEYALANADIARALGGNLEAIAAHYQDHGQAEHRATSGFDAMGYLAANPDLIMAYGANTDGAKDHYLAFGATERRVTSGFNASSYLAANADLRAAFGTNTGAATQHYVAYGYREGRSLVPTTRGEGMLAGA